VRDPVFDLAPHQRRRIAASGRGEVLHVTLQPASAGVADDPLAAADYRRHAVRGRKVLVRWSKRPLLAQAPQSFDQVRHLLHRVDRASEGRVSRRRARVAGSSLDREREQQRSATRDRHLRLLGSGTIAASALSSRAAASPPAPVDSSSVTVLTRRSPASGVSSSARTSAAITMHATPPFMSHAPRPQTAPR
jgi:hypothetical protein